MVYLLEHLFRVVWHEEVRLYLRNGERGSLLIYLRKVIRKNQEYYVTKCCRESVL